MLYFLPFASSSLQAERIYRRITDRVTSLGYTLSRRRIHDIHYWHEGVAIHETVGVSSANGETVLAIFKAGACFFICTYSRGVVWGDPMMACPSSTDSVDYFDDDVSVATV
ncbi:hypothetical protein [Fibrella aquatilis]|uniref:Uncharacterized protein n=1 Tax=Fibrella aquatilis TaxID=2817059 RepID=A0A939G328_9BACT|nr:hypothetical protein [Fibrella aquatilis]MBO0931437.1 hypothetical protein [Fibrella aquatilis]